MLCGSFSESKEKKLRLNDVERRTFKFIKTLGAVSGDRGRPVLIHGGHIFAGEGGDGSAVFGSLRGCADVELMVWDAAAGGSGAEDSC